MIILIRDTSFVFLLFFPPPPEMGTLSALSEKYPVHSQPYLVSLAGLASV